MGVKLHLGFSISNLDRFPMSTRIWACLTLVFSVLGVASSANAAPSSAANSLVATAGNQQVTLTFTQPELTPGDSSPGGNDVRAGYVINVYQSGTKIGSNDSSCVDNSNSTSESCVISTFTLTVGGGAGQLSNGVAYTFTVIARWSNGATETLGDESTQSSATTPFTKPEKPEPPTAVVNSVTSTSADISWIAPVDNGETIDGYTVKVYDKAGTTEASGPTGCTTATLTCTVTGLSNGSAYTFKVSARNDGGDSTYSNASATFTVASSKPTNVATAKTVSGTTVTIDVTWSEPSPNSETITGYTISASDGSNTATKTWSTGELKVSFTASTSGADLVLGTGYSITVKATNAGGESASSDPATVTPSRAPDAPGTPSATFATTTATVTWTAPTSNGGQAVSEYTASAFPSSDSNTNGTPSGSCTSTGALQCTITGLAPNTGYKFAVKAKNDANGYGVYSSLSSAATSPAAITAPGSPTGVSATFSLTTATVTWIAPGSNGGEAITEYTAAAFPSSATNTSGTPLGICTSTGALSCSIQNLSNSTSYKFAVKAKNNSAGYGAYSSLSVSVTSPAAPVQETPATNNPTTETPITPTPVSPPAASPSPETTAPPANTLPPVALPVAQPASSTSLSGTPVVITREPSAAISTNTEVAISSKTVKLLLEVPKSASAKSQVTKYIIELKPTKGSVIRKTITVKPGQTVKPTLSGKSKTSYSISVTAVQKSGKKSVWKGPKVTTK